MNISSFKFINFIFVVEQMPSINPQWLIIHIAQRPVEGYVLENKENATGGFGVDDLPVANIHF